MRITQTPLSKVQQTPTTGESITELEEGLCDLAETTDSQIVGLEEGLCDQATDADVRFTALEARIAALEAAQEGETN